MPFERPIDKMSSQEQRSYFAWFVNSIPERLALLSSAVQRTPSYEGWTADFSFRSLETLAAWFSKNVHVRERSHDEMAQLNVQLATKIPLPSEELTPDTFSLCADSGAYLAEYLRALYPHLRWEIKAGSNADIDYGHPVVNGFGPMSLNPVRIMVNLAYAEAANRRNRSLPQIAQYWSDLAQKHKQ